MHLPRQHSFIPYQIFCLALLHGLLYAAFTPPWGLIDEVQHFHYIKFISENGSLPVVGETLLSTDLVDSLFATQHWQTFHWSTPTGQSIEQLGAVGHSYEAYQPPLFYLLMAPILSVLPGDVLTQLFLVRCVMVILSLSSLFFLWLTANLIFPQEKQWAIFVTLLMVAIPERTFAVSRLNNDVLIEVFGCAIVWLCTTIFVYGLTVRRSIQLSFLLATGLWVKLSLFVMIAPLTLLFWCCRHADRWKQSVMIAASIIGTSFCSLVMRNLLLYGDWSGISAFQRIMPPTPPDWTLGNFLSASYQMFAHVWVIWWKGAEIGSNFILTGFYSLFAIVLLTSLFTIAQQVLHTNSSMTRSEREIVSLYLLMIVAYAGATIVSYFQGMIPVVQGRFLLPVMIPIVIIWSWGVRTLRFVNWIMLGGIGLIFVLDFLSLWGNLLPYYYYWSTFSAQNNFIQSPLSIFDALKILIDRVSADKPDWVDMSLPWLTTIYYVILAWVVRTVVGLFRANQQ